MIIALQVTALIMFILFITAFIISINEKEYFAAKRFLILSLTAPIPYLAVSIIKFDYQLEAGIVLLAVTYGFAAALFFPTLKNKKYKQAVPKKRYDERSTMFSRRELTPGAETFEEYYELNPDNLNPDNLFRQKPGLLSSKATQFNPFQFAAAESSFETIKFLRNKVDGKVNEEKTHVDAEKLTLFIKKWSQNLGAEDCGITRLKEYHLYSIGGRDERYGKKVNNDHTFAIAFTVEMKKEMVSSAPAGPIVMESGQQYLDSGIVAIQTAQFIRSLGYKARAHIDANYEVICPLVARDAGLGELGRMGLLMTPRLGPRVRISVVTTDVPLIADPPLNDFSMIDFCIQCKKCADSCPSKAIPFDDMREIDGIERWKINHEACYTLWCALGTDCGRCMSVCPFSHPDNIMHNFVRAGIKNSSIFRKFAVKLDDIFYGRKPHPAKLPKWLDI